MQADHSRITKVDTQTPFHSKQDAFQRLAAYHVYYEPEPSEAIENRGMKNVQWCIKLKPMQYKFLPVVYRQTLTNRDAHKTPNVVSAYCLCVILLVVEQMHDILARELMKKSRGLTAKYHHLLLKDMEVCLFLLVVSCMLLFSFCPSVCKQNIDTFVLHTYLHCIVSCMH